MKKMLTFVMASAFLFVSQNLLAEKLFVDVDGTGLEVTQWETREVTTRKWRPGCMQYDVLQGTGWFPRTWHIDYTPELVEEDLYYFETSSGFWRWYCQAEMDEINYVQLEMDSGVEGAPLQGRFRVVPGGESNEAVVTCSVDKKAVYYNAIVCDDAVVATGNSIETYVIVELD